MRATTALYTAAQAQVFDRVAIDEFNIDGYELMQRASASVVRLIRLRWPQVRAVSVLCGAGNNGGDGLVVARLLMAQGYRVMTALLGKESALRGDAKLAFDDFVAEGGSLCSPADCVANCCELIVDAVFGSGLSRPVTGDTAELITAVNRSEMPVVAVDTPSGLCSTSGAVLGTAVRASATVTFIARKRGLLTADGPDCCGDLFFDDLAVPQDVYASQSPVAHCVDSIKQLPRLPQRPVACHKGQCGHILVVGGNKGYSGAAQLAGRACLRAGAGRVTVACHPGSVAVVAGTSELMTSSVEDASTRDMRLDKYDVIAIGPGLGTDSWASGLMEQVLHSGKPLVLDADALNLLSKFDISALPANSVLTPHPAEAGRLLAIDTASVQSDRFTAVSEIAQRYSATALLKGNGTLVCNTSATTLINAGVPAMATAGMGDVLTGIIAALMGQGLTGEQAAIFGATLHAEAGYLASQRFGVGLVASDVIQQVSEMLCNP